MLKYSDIIILGVVQGITEFLPISSSGHLFLLQKYMGISDGQLILDISLHVGTALSILVYFGKDIRKIIAEHKNNLKYVFIATIPAAIAGLSLGSFIHFILQNC